MIKIKRALISVSDKKGIVDFARGLASLGIELISTGGTAKVLKEAGIAVRELSGYTGFPEMLDGRLKTLHPVIHAGLLALRDNRRHLEELSQHHIGLIDMVVVNLYPFGDAVAGPGVSLEEAVENIDIGGVSLLRAAAKNFFSVAAVSAPKFYPLIGSELAKYGGCISEETARSLAVEAFSLTSRYDGLIFQFLRGELGPKPLSLFPDVLTLNLEKRASLRYGENPHQKAALYKISSTKLITQRTKRASLVEARQLQGKELSYNNYLDLSAALQIVSSFNDPAACIVKHANPAGVAQYKDLARAYRYAWQTDPLSAFGGIVGFNRKVSAQTARVVLKSSFLECVLAPGYEPAALALFGLKKNLRVLETVFSGRGREDELDLKQIDGGFLVQEPDSRDFKKEDLRCVTRRRPGKSELAGLLFAWRVVKYVKSNAIVVASGNKTVGIGMGETSRVDSCFMALKKAGGRGRGAVLASEAFFPKTDSIALAKKAGIKAIIQPGGSIADQEVIRAADKAGIAMVFTGFRHFRH